MAIRECVVCGVTFDALGSAKACSDECRKVNRMAVRRYRYRKENCEANTLPQNCAGCGDRLPEEHHGARRYCSDTCRHRARAKVRFATEEGRKKHREANAKWYRKNIDKKRDYDGRRRANQTASYVEARERYNEQRREDRRVAAKAYGAAKLRAVIAGFDESVDRAKRESERGAVAEHERRALRRRESSVVSECAICGLMFEWFRTSPGGTRVTCGSKECRRKRHLLMKEIRRSRCVELGLPRETPLWKVKGSEAREQV